MKFSQIRRITQATVLSLAIGLGMTACSEDYTIDFLYVTTSRSSTGNISAYKVDNQSGSLTQIVDSPFSSGGRDPVAIVLSPNNQALYVVNNQDSTIVEFLIGTDGKIYMTNTYNLGPTAKGGTYPTAAVIDAANKYLVVTFSYQINVPVATPPTLPGPGGIAVFPINSDNSLGTVVANGTLPYFPVSANPVSIGISPNPNNCPTSGGTVSASCPINGGNYVPSIYVVEDTTTTGLVLTYSLSLSTGQLTAVASTAAGVVPYAIAEDPTGRFVYITDQSANQLIGYIVQANGSLNAMVNGPFSTGLYPEGITADPRGKYIYVTNYNASTLNGYAIDQATGTPSGVFSNGTTATGTGPTCVTIEPSQGIYLYTSNFVDNSVSGLQLDPHTGALVNIQNTPFSAAGGPTCAVTVSAGSHAYQALQP